MLIQMVEREGGFIPEKLMVEEEEDVIESIILITEEYVDKLIANENNLQDVIKATSDNMINELPDAKPATLAELAAIEALVLGEEGEEDD
jgi:hypothetical protein